jgi:hypothetical protein
MKSTKFADNVVLDYKPIGWKGDKCFLIGETGCFDGMADQDSRFKVDFQDIT